MSDKATMLRETVEAFADLRTMFDGLTEEQASRVWLGVLRWPLAMPKSKRWRTTSLPVERERSPS
jgi:hypothetical protein